MSASASAQTNERLRGIKAFELVIEDLPEAAKTCGIDRKALETSGRFVLGQSRVRIDPKAQAYLYILLNVVTLPSRDICIYYLQVSARGAAMALENNAFVMGELWTSGSVGSASRRDLPRDTVMYLEQYLKEFVVAWSKVN